MAADKTKCKCVCLFRVDSHQAGSCLVHGCCADGLSGTCLVEEQEHKTRHTDRDDKGYDFFLFAQHHEAKSMDPLIATLRYGL